MGAYPTEIEQAKSFVEKTLQIISQYEKAEQEIGFEKLDVTLWINCLIGLLIVPQQFFSSNKTSERTKKPVIITADNENEWGIKISNIDYGANDIGVGKREIKNDAHLIAKHIRNSLAHHNRFTLRSYDGAEVSHLHFVDYLKDNKSKTFECEFRVEDARKFVLNYVQIFLNSQS